MSDLISRQAAMDALERLQKDISGDYTNLDPLVMVGTAYIGDCIGELQDLPSAQPEIIRCKDCKYHEQAYQGAIWCDTIEAFADENWFCATAERKDS